MTPSAVVRFVAGSTLVLAGVGLLPAGAAAHTEVVGVVPASGTVLAQPPDQVRLTFASALLDRGYAMVVTGEDGTKHKLNAEAAGTSLTAPWDSAIPTGRLTLAYRVVARDGHPIVGSARWTLASSEQRADSPSGAPVRIEANTDEPQTGARSVGLIASIVILVGLGAGLLVRRSRTRRIP